MEKKGFVFIKSRIKDHCSAYDPFGLCPVTDCFKCENADYRIISNNGNIIRDYRVKKFENDDIEIETYEIEFFDHVNYDNIEEYLINENSDYRLTRLKDQVVMRLSCEDRRKELERVKEFETEKNEMLLLLIGEQELKRRQEAENKELGKIKRLIKKIKRG